jgi:D-alanyl-D-alanine carboxypeptidase
MLAALTLVGTVQTQSAEALSRSKSGAVESLAARIDALLAKTYPADKPGAACLVIRNGAMILRKGYGMADLEQAVPMTPEAVFACGSMTKMFTATAVMMLAEDGRLGYGDPISMYFPDAPAAWKGIPIDHLLSHTSGLLDLFKIPAWVAQWKEEISPQALIAFFKDKPLQFEPGTKPDYSNSNYALLGQIVEKASGLPLDQFAKSRIIEPLGLKETRFAVSHGEIIPRRARLYLLGRDGSIMNPP